MNLTKRQLTTFSVGNNLFGIDVMEVQEVTNSLQVVDVPLAPSFVKGLINLRGQLATAIGLRELLSIDDQEEERQMSVICKIEENLVSLFVDKIGDVVEVNEDAFEVPPKTLDENIRSFLRGIYKLEGQLLCVIDLKSISEKLSPNIESVKQSIS